LAQCVRCHAQGDIAPLLAALLGVSIPVNSVGMLPLRYLDADGMQKDRALFDIQKTSRQSWQ